MGWRSPLILQHHLEYRHIPEPLLAHVGLGEAHQRIKHCPCDPQNSVSSPRHRASLAAQTLARQSIPDALLWFGDGWVGGYGQRCIFSFYFFYLSCPTPFSPPGRTDGPVPPSCCCPSREAGPGHGRERLQPAGPPNTGTGPTSPPETQTHRKQTNE